ncbi:proline dehydrogenase [Coemansia spiralis]|uniref:Proline dehydrogenase n=2 Tax=Coemansia TaxID=4863 RepID=A0A9W8GAJ9_9FUNG|nr:FAD-linked oxidoreductase-like protein [Coemansia spiralis]KAJ1995551.1 proline dehydrogenase [Coemansia umbellata]KAJ2625117.1 proline dehydrogenase [Coemansia sp. RSA 1358]KAJ2679930.1 proline dehydrogenase [Coemansia spiralis]
MPTCSSTSAIAALTRPTAFAKPPLRKQPLLAAYVMPTRLSFIHSGRPASTAALLTRHAGAPAPRTPRAMSLGAQSTDKAAVVSLARGISASSQPRVPAASREPSPSEPTVRATTLPADAADASAPSPPSPNNSLLRPDPTLALSQQGVLKLMALWLVYRACGNTALVRMAPGILKVFERTHLSWLSNAVIRRTFFAWFCAGEKEREIVHTMRRLKDAGIGSILDYSAEADLTDCDARAAADSARAQANVKADALAKEYFHGMHMASQVPRAFAAIKVTGLADPEVLYRLSMPYRRLRAAFEDADHDHDGRIDYTQFKNVVLPAMPGGSRVASPSGIFSMVDASNNDGLVDWVDIQMALGLDNPLARPLYLRSSNTGGIEEYGAIESDIEDYERMISRTRAVIQQAADKGVRTMIDAEHTYFQPMIDHVALVMQREFNSPQQAGGRHGSSTLVYNTYQMYRADAYQRMVDDYERAEREGWRFAAKLVRGAYMEMERERAERLGYPSPINPTLEATHECYNRGVRFLMDRIASSHRSRGDTTMQPALFVATHNNESIERALQLIRELEIDTSNEPVMFGQLLGMQDATSYALAREKLPIYKYVPYGSLDEVLPYLIRRAQENSAVADSIIEESSFVMGEILRRVFRTSRKQASVSSTSSST